MRAVDFAYSGYIASCCGVSFASARRTAGPQPEVFSLKSRRILLARPSAGASYVLRLRIAERTGKRTFIGESSQRFGGPQESRPMQTLPRHLRAARNPCAKFPER